MKRQMQQLRRVASSLIRINPVYEILSCVREVCFGYVIKETHLSKIVK